VPTPTQIDVRAEDPTRHIIVLRGQRVIVDFALAALYGSTTKRLNEQVKRNLARFPEDFMFRLDARETEAVNRSQIATSYRKHRRSDYRPFAFTEHGAIMAATILNSPCAIEMSVYVVRAFVRLRAYLASNRELSLRLKQIESRLESRLIDHEKAISEILLTIRSLTERPSTKARPIGFTADLDK
jgi:hypothetical protein